MSLTYWRRHVLSPNAGSAQRCPTLYAVPQFILYVTLVMNLVMSLGTPIIPTIILQGDVLNLTHSIKIYYSLFLVRPQLDHNLKFR